MAHPKFDQQVSETVGGTLLSHQIYTYKCHECGEWHTTKEGAVEICPGSFDKEGE